MKFPGSTERVLTPQGPKIRNNCEDKNRKKLSVDWYKKSSRTFLELSKNYTRSRESLKKAFFEKQQQGYSGRTERNKSMNLKVGDFHVNQRLYKSLGFTYCFFFEKWKLW